MVCAKIQLMATLLTYVDLPEALEPVTRVLWFQGGNGVDNGDQEILTETMREYIDYENNAVLCLGVIGSGNKNFNYQYCLTAKQYAEQFSIPFLADFELRGTTQDIERIYACLKEINPAHSNT